MSHSCSTYGKTFVGKDTMMSHSSNPKGCSKQTIEDKLSEMFDVLLYAHTDCVATLEKYPNITLAEWVASYKAKSPIEDQVKNLAEIIGENYEDRVADMNEQFKPELETNVDYKDKWEAVYVNDPFVFEPTDLLTSAGLADNVLAKRYVTGDGGPASGYFELINGTVYSYSQKGTWQNCILTKLDNCKIEFRRIPDEEPECRIVKTV